MKKLFLILLTFILVGCKKEIKIPKLQSVSLVYHYGAQIDLSLDQILDLSSFTPEQKEQLEKEVLVDYSKLKYDEINNIQPGTYKIEISYYEDVVETILKVIGKDSEEPEIITLEEPIEVKYGDVNFNFAQVIQVTSPLDLDMHIIYDNSLINYYEEGAYSLKVTVTDANGNTVKKIFKVNILARQIEGNTEDKPESIASSTNTKPGSTNSTSNVKPGNTNPTPNTPSSGTTPNNQSQNTTSNPNTQENPNPGTNQQPVEDTPPVVTPVIPEDGGGTVPTPEVPVDPVPDTNEGSNP